MSGVFENAIRSIAVFAVIVTVALAALAMPVAATSHGTQGVMPGDNVNFPDSAFDEFPGQGDDHFPDSAFDEFPGQGDEHFPDSTFDGIPGQGDEHFPDSIFDDGDKDGSDPVITK